MDKYLKEILRLIESKASVKQDVFAHTKDAFRQLKKSAIQVIEELDAANEDKRVVIKLSEINAFEFRIIIGGDILVFYMHTNVFQYPKSHYYWQGSYFKDDPARSYCGIIYVYNFLADSIQQNREKDLGFLIARILVNKENNFALEGKGRLNMLFSRISCQKFDEEKRYKVVESLICYSMEFELYIPPYRQNQTISVRQVQEFRKGIKLKTAKRLGFEFGKKNPD